MHCGCYSLLLAAACCCCLLPLLAAACCRLLPLACKQAAASIKHRSSATHTRLKQTRVAFKLAFQIDNPSYPRTAKHQASIILSHTHDSKKRQHQNSGTVLTTESAELAFQIDTREKAKEASKKINLQTNFQEQNKGRGHCVPCDRPFAGLLPR